MKEFLHKGFRQIFDAELVFRREVLQFLQRASQLSFADFLCAGS